MVLAVPIVPETITVHLGAPNAAAPNVTVSFIDYIKNVASSELYPTWPESALRANILAQISYTLNRIYTEWYPSQGYDFDITNVTQFDQSYVHNRDIFENISRIVDEIFDSYIRRPGQVAPFISPYCDGVQTVCDGLSQWGSVDLANQGFDSFQILQYYYGNDIELVQGVPVVGDDIESYPGYPLQYGDFNRYVAIIQARLNRIATNYPSIPKINPVDGVFDAQTVSAVRRFQQIFGLDVDGVVGKSTWYQISYYYTVVKRLAEIESEGVNYGLESLQLPQELGPGDTFTGVDILQYFLGIIGSFNEFVAIPEITGTYDALTEQSVRDFQAYSGLPVTGRVDFATWDRIYDDYIGTIDALPLTVSNVELRPFGGVLLRQGSTGEDVYLLQSYLAGIAGFYQDIPAPPINGVFDAATQNSVVAYQRLLGLQPDGIVGAATWNAILDDYKGVLRRTTPAVPQYPGYPLAF